VKPGRGATTGETVADDAGYSNLYLFAESAVFTRTKIDTSAVSKVSQGGVRSNQNFRIEDRPIEVGLKSYKLDNCISFKNKRSVYSSFASRACGLGTDADNMEEPMRSLKGSALK